MVVAGVAVGSPVDGVVVAGVVVGSSVDGVGVDGVVGAGSSVVEGSVVEGSLVAGGAATGVADPVIAISPLPMALTATIPKEYETPLVSPATVQDVPWSAQQPVMFLEPRPSRTRTSYLVVGEPPSAVGDVHDTTALWSPATADGS